jgi:hypothetical protein
MGDSLDALAAIARRDVDALSNDPEARYAMRAAFYRRWGKSGDGDVGIGRSELDFMRWEITRGVLDASSGSAWWRRVNARLIYDARLAELIVDRAPSLDPGTPAARRWLEFMRSTDAASWARLWYRAHDASIVSGYLDAIDEARAEPSSERFFVNVVLYRLLYAEALVEGVALGLLGRVLADPRMPSVEALLDLPGYYPAHYPMTNDELRDLVHRGHSLSADLLDVVLDDVLILPELDTLYARAAEWLDLPALTTLAVNGRPRYPAA